MKIWYSRTALLVGVLLLIYPALAQAQMNSVQQRRPPDAEKKLVIFIHAGPLGPTHDVVKAVAIELAGKSDYLVRAPDGDLDVGGGPGVDYFDKAAEPKAEEIVKIVNAVLAKSSLNIPEGRLLKARLQTSTKNPPEYFGVWLFSKDVLNPR
jgi:hypothetical protein